MTSALLEVADVWDGDPLNPGMDAPTPVEVVATLTRPQREQRVTALIAQTEAILADALATHVDGHQVVGVCLLWSGGNDSNTLAHLMRSHATHAVHANTGIGIERTRQFVRDTAAAWGLPLLERNPPARSTYRDYVLEHGFPGPGQHYRIYQRIKERALRQVRRELVTNGYRQRVIYLAGRRRQESKRRAGTAGHGKPIPAHEREDSMIWVSPLVNWTKLDINTYQLMHRDVPHNPVSDLLHMSGECLCGSYAKPRELDQLRDWFPDVAAEIEALEAEVRAAGVPEPRYRWGWGAYRTDAQRGPLDRDQDREDNQVGRLCASCGPPGPVIATTSPLPPHPEDSRMSTHTPNTDPTGSEGAALLDELRAALTRYVVMPSEHATDAVVLWIAASHAQPAWAHAPRLVIRAPERRCGKSRLLDIVEAGSHEPLITVNASPSAVYRSITADPPTLLVDEADTIFGPKAGDNEDLRGLFNAGHQRGRPALRYDAASSSVVTIPTFAMAALAGIGAMPDTIEDRAVVVHMRRKVAGEKADPYRTRRDRGPLRTLADRLTAWLRADLAVLEQAEPAMPVEDRAADTWEPLIAVADHAGGEWPERARAAALALTTEASETGEMSDRLRLLADCRTAFAADPALPTAELLARLRALPESPWGELGVTGITGMKLASLLREYGIRSANIRFTRGQAKGYQRADFTDAWARYCPEPDTDSGQSQEGEPSQPSQASQRRSDVVRLETWDGSSRPNREARDGSSRPTNQAVPGLTSENEAGTAGTATPLSSDEGVA